MQFDRPQRFNYKKNPLAEVICQVRFPRVFQIDSELPVAFHNEIRGDYPLSELSEQVVVAQPAQDGEGKSEATLTSARTFSFLDAKKEWKISLCSTFIALTATSSYRRWEEFRDRFARALNVTEAIYKPGLSTRVGLRYKDLIVRSALGLEGMPWSDLLTGPLVAPFTTPPVTEQAVEGIESAFVFALDNGRLRLRTDLFKNDKNKETAILIDSDFYFEGNEVLNVDAILTRLANFNRNAGGLFRWCITDRLHRALEPEPIG